ncbi:MAG: hypothetical protein CUN54_08340 [Phototrophicales bacterium]|nr:MAG: hypothetical protein CUN54_08340 [Phototrophicales bacterium]
MTYKPRYGARGNRRDRARAEQQRLWEKIQSYEGELPQRLRQQIKHAEQLKTERSKLPRLQIGDFVEVTMPGFDGHRGQIVSAETEYHFILHNCQMMFAVEELELIERPKQIVIWQKPEIIVWQEKTALPIEQRGQLRIKHETSSVTDSVTDVQTSCQDIRISDYDAALRWAWTQCGSLAHYDKSDPDDWKRVLNVAAFKDAARRGYVPKHLYMGD